MVAANDDTTVYVTCHFVLFLTEMTTPAPTELPTIYRSGDLVLQNPQETCVIFVTVVLISAFLEFVLQRIGNVDNKYARILVNTMTQEVTIVGVLALFLMFTVSVIPRRFITPLYVTLFSWANISLFFMATFFVMIIIFQFVWARFDITRWKNYEEGRLDSEDDLRQIPYKNRIYKLLFEKYKVELDEKAGLSTAAVPFFEYTGKHLRKFLVRVSNLSYRTWLSLSFVVLANLLRTKLTPFIRRGQTESDFGNAMMFVGVIGFGNMFVFLLFFLFLQRRIFLYANDRLETKAPHTLVPFGSPKRGMEFLQIMTMSFNWYLTLFITGNAKQISTMSDRWRLGVVYTLFVLPFAVFLLLLPWTFLSISFLHVLGNVSAKEAARIQATLKGEYGGDDSDDDEDDEEEEGPVKATAAEVAGDGESTAVLRPMWLDDDDDWDGQRTLPAGTLPRSATGAAPTRSNAPHSAGVGGSESGSFALNSSLAGLTAGPAESMLGASLAGRPMPFEPRKDHHFYDNVNIDQLRRMLSEHEDPLVRQVAKTMGAGARISAQPGGLELDGASTAAGTKATSAESGTPFGRPLWIDSDEDWDEASGVKVKKPERTDGKKQRKGKR